MELGAFKVCESLLFGADTAYIQRPCIRTPSPVEKICLRKDVDSLVEDESADEQESGIARCSVELARVGHDSAFL
jgi:hypothetical protein